MQCNIMHVLQCIAMDCNALLSIQCNATYCQTKQCNATQWDAMQCNAFKWSAIRCNVMQYNIMAKVQTCEARLLQFCSRHAISFYTIFQIEKNETNFAFFASSIQRVRFSKLRKSKPPTLAYSAKVRCLKRCSQI